MESFAVAGHGNDLKLRSRLRMAASNILRRARGRSANRNGNGNNNNGGRSHHHHNKGNNYPPRNCNHRANGAASNNNLEEGRGSGAAFPSDNADGLCLGPFTREVYSAICGRLGETLNIPEEAVLPLFHDMHLYPSKQQVSDMLQCARQCGRRNGLSYLTFAEFCVFAREMQTVNRLTRNALRSKRGCTGNCEVFLGGSCNPTTWRVDTAIPELQKHGITYYNPQVPSWAPELVAAEHNAKESASVLLYVVDSQTRSVSGMIEVAYLVASGRCVVLVAYQYSLGQSIMGEVLTKRECYDLISGQTTLLALVKSQGIKVHTNLTSAIQCTTKLLRNPCVNNGMTAEEQITFKLRKLRETFDCYDQRGTGEISLMDVVDAYSRLTNRNIEPLHVHNYLNSANADSNARSFTFQHFCALVAEFSVDGCENFSNAWVGRPLHCTRYPNDNDVNVNVAGTADIFLGGSCRGGPCRWRERAAPLIRRHGLTCYNPDGRGCANGNVLRTDDALDESAVLQWRRAVDRSRVLLFIVSGDSRGLTTMIMAAYYIGLGRDVVLCVQHLSEDDGRVGDEKLSKQAIKDYNRGRVYLTDLAKRKHVAVFENITRAVQCAIEKCRR